MALSNPALYAALESFEIDALGFTRRLARDNGWSVAVATRVVEEYRRFIYLCTVVERPMTPSHAVDQAWHLHLTHTRSYWDELCPRVLGRPLHHEPGRGGDGERFRMQYQDTLASYAREFDQAPPPDIWPGCATRFGTAHRRVAPRWRSLGLATAALAAAVTPAAAVEIEIPPWFPSETVMTLHSWAPWAIGGLWLLMAIRGGLRHRQLRRRRDAAKGPWEWPDRRGAACSGSSQGWAGCHGDGDGCGGGCSD